MLPDGQKVEQNGRNPENTRWIPVFWFPVHPVCECAFERVAAQHCSSRNRPKHRGVFPRKITPADNSGNLCWLVV